jgi:DNA-directed RNA polymerase specialized sigma24 family protein
LTPEAFVGLIEQTLARRPEAARQLVAHLYPVVQARVARVLVRAGRVSGRSARQEVDDMTQDVFAFLFEDGGKPLRAWEPARGLSLPNFVGLIAERHAVSVLRSGRRSPWTEEPRASHELDHQVNAVDEGGGGAAGTEVVLLSRDLLATLLDRLRELLSPLGMELFRQLFVDEKSVEEICADMKMSSDAVYAWRSRLRKLVAGLAAELTRTRPTPAVRTEGVRS